MKESLWIALCLMICIVPATAVRAQGPATEPSPEELSKFMRVKLVHSQKLLEALVTEDFDEMVKRAQDLKLLSHESTWNILETEEYVLDSGDFRRRADSLIKTAKAKNLEGASLSFVELTLSCVHCHKHVRDGRSKSPEPVLPPPKSSK